MTKAISQHSHIYMPFTIKRQLMAYENHPEYDIGMCITADQSTDRQILRNASFRISQKKVFSLLEGSNIYMHKLVFLRGVLYNAFDATKLQYWKNYLPPRDNGLSVISRHPDAAAARSSSTLLSGSLWSTTQ